MPVKMYACPKYPYYRIKHLRFEHGLLRVHTEEDQHLIENNGFYGAHIFPVPMPEEEKKDAKSKEIGSTPGDAAPKRQSASKGKSRRKKSEKGDRGRGKAVRPTKTPETVGIADDSAVSG